MGTALHRKSNSKGLRAAASLKKTFTDIGEQFKTENLGASVEFLMAGSSDLITQLTQAADANTSASADTKHGQGSAGRSAGGNPVNFASFKDLTQQGLNPGVCAPQVPCGSATQKVEKATGVKMNPVSEESSVSDILNRVTTG